MEVTPPPSVTLASPVQPSKALLLMGAPSVAPVMDVQPANALEPMAVSSPENDTLLRFGQFRAKLSGMKLTEVELMWMA